MNAGIVFLNYFQNALESVILSYLITFTTNIYYKQLSAYAPLPPSKGGLATGHSTFKSREKLTFHDEDKKE